MEIISQLFAPIATYFGMETARLVELFAQAVGILAMCFSIISFQQKSRRNILILQVVGASLFVFNFLLLGQYIGAVLNLLGCARYILFLHKDKLHTDNNLWLGIFTALYFGAYVLCFTVFGEEPTLPNLALQILPVLGMIFGHLAFRSSDPAKIRKISLASSVSWLTFNSIVFSVGAILCEVFNIVSIFIAMARFDRKKQ